MKETEKAPEKKITTSKKVWNKLSNVIKRKIIFRKKFKGSGNPFVKG